MAITTGNRICLCFFVRGVKLFSPQTIRCATSYRQTKSSAEDDCENVSVSVKPRKRIPLTVEDFKSLRGCQPSQPENPHLLKVSILGEPNVGKSTLTNSLVRWKVSAVSRKVHTTRKKISAILVEDNKQIVFLDTPGFVTPEMTKKHSLEASFVMDPKRSIVEAHIIAVVVDISNRFTNNRINEEILTVLEDFKEKTSILILNKVDAMKSKSKLLSMTKILTGGVVGGSQFPEGDETEEKRKEDSRGWKSFSKVFMVSALNNDGVDDLRHYLLGATVPHDWVYNDCIVTDQHPHDIAVTVVREKLLEYLPEEIPYLLQLKVTKWEILSTGCPKISIQITCSNDRHKRFVIGPGGKHIAVCVEKSRKAMRESFRKDVVLHIAVV